MNNSAKRIGILIALLALAAGLAVWFATRGRAPVPDPFPPPAEITMEEVLPPPEPTPTATPTPRPTPKLTPPPEPKIKKAAQPPAPAPVAVAPEVPPPPIQLHKELIPKDIEIVRVYYTQSLTGPGSVIEFDINGSGFNEEFEKMIAVESGSPKVDVRELKLKTPNQIGGVLVIKSDAPTGAVFPQVSIQGKVVFRAPDPFAVIRPGEVLNLVFTEMGESGRSGKFRVFTNLTQDMFDRFSINVNTDSIRVSDVTPNLPFIVDSTLLIGPAPAGSYDISIRIAEHVIWEREGIIRVIQPNVGQSGLAQQVRAVDGFYRPGDQARFVLQGSGFQPRDVDLLAVQVQGFSVVASSMVYRSPGRMEFSVTVPKDAPEKAYGLQILQDETVLLSQDGAFSVVGKNWAREFNLDPALKPGEKSSLQLRGRDLDKTFVKKIQVELDTEDLTIGSFVWKSADLSVADIAASETIVPGDYLIKMSVDGAPVHPQFGSIIRIE